MVIFDTRHHSGPPPLPISVEDPYIGYMYTIGPHNHVRQDHTGTNGSWITVGQHIGRIHQCDNRLSNAK